MLSLHDPHNCCYPLKIFYDTSDNLESVELTPATRRTLAEEENDAAAVEGRRLEFDGCTACEDAWVSLCAGASSVCDLVGHGSPLSTAAVASIDTMCGTFGTACSTYEASEACQDQCTDEGLSHQYITFLGSACIIIDRFLVAGFRCRFPALHVLSALASLSSRCKSRTCLVWRLCSSVRCV